MKKILIPILIIVVLGTVLVFYFNNNSKSGSEDNTGPKQEKNGEENYFNPVDGEENFKKIVIPGLRIMSIDSDSPLLNKVGLVNLNEGNGYSDNSLQVGDIITGISLDYDKTNLLDILLRERPSKYFIPVNGEQELYSEINKLKTTKIMLGIVRKVMAGTGYVYRPDIAVFEVEKLERNYLKTTFLPNSKELYK